MKRCIDLGIPTHQRPLYAAIERAFQGAIPTKSIGCPLLGPKASLMLSAAFVTNGGKQKFAAFEIDLIKILEADL